MDPMRACDPLRVRPRPVKVVVEILEPGAVSAARFSHSHTQALKKKGMARVAGEGGRQLGEEMGPQKGKSEARPRREERETEDVRLLFFLKKQMDWIAEA